MGNQIDIEGMYGQLVTHYSHQIADNMPVSVSRDPNKIRSLLRQDEIRIPAKLLMVAHLQESVVDYCKRNNYPSAFEINCSSQQYNVELEAALHRVLPERAYDSIPSILENTNSAIRQIIVDPVSTMCEQINRHYNPSAIPPGTPQTQVGNINYHYKRSPEQWTGDERLL